MAASVCAARNCVLFFLALARASSRVRRRICDAPVTVCCAACAAGVLAGGGVSWAAALREEAKKRAATETQNRTSMRHEFMRSSLLRRTGQDHRNDDCDLAVRA